MEIELPDGTILDAPDDADPSAVARAYMAKQTPAPAPSMGQQVKRQLGLTARIGADTLAALPLVAADAGIAARNLITGSNYDSASMMYDQAMSNILPKPETGIEKGVNIAGQMVLGSKMPAPQAAKQAPTEFIAKNPSMRDLMRANAKNKGYTQSDYTPESWAKYQSKLNEAPPSGFLASLTDNPVTRFFGSGPTAVLKQSQNYVIPPSTVNPSTTNKVLESIGGKIAMEQDASLRNQKVTDSLVKRALGLSQDEILGPGTLESIRAQAGKVYADIGKTGNVKIDQRFVNEVAQLPKTVADEIAPQVGARIDSSAGGIIRRGYDDVPASVLMQKLRELRFESQRNLSALAAQNPESAKLGKAQKRAAEYVEELLMRHLRSNNAGKLADEFSDARKLIAQTHTVQKAMNEVTGEINAAKLAQQLAKGKPLSGDLKKVSEFATAFPKASKLVLDSGPVRNTDVILGAGTAALSREPSYLLYPFARQMVRAGLLSDVGQSALTTPGLQPHPGAAQSLVYGSRGLLGQ